MRSNRARGAEATTGLAATTQGPARRWATSAGRTVLPCLATHHPRGGECVGETRCRLAADGACAVLVPGLGGWATAPPQNCHAHCRHAVLAAGAQRRRQAARRACQKLSRHYDHGEELWQALRHAPVAIVAGVHPAHFRRRVRLRLCTWAVGPWGGLLVVAGWWGRCGGRHVVLPWLAGPLRGRSHSPGHLRYAQLSACHAHVTYVTGACYVGGHRGEAWGGKPAVTSNRRQTLCRGGGSGGTEIESNLWHKPAGG